MPADVGRFLAIDGNDIRIRLNLKQADILPQDVWGTAQSRKAALRNYKDETNRYAHMRNIASRKAEEKPQAKSQQSSFTRPGTGNTANYNEGTTEEELMYGDARGGPSIVGDEQRPSDRMERKYGRT